MASLPVAGKASADGKALGLSRRVLRHLLGESRSGPNDRHVANEDVDELWQLVDAELADDAADTGNARIVGNLEDGTILLVEVPELCEPLLGVCAHGAELVHAEGLSVTANALLGKEDRPLGVVDLDGNGNDEEEPTKANQHEGTKEDVKGALDEAVRPTPRPQALGRCLHL